MKRKLRHPINSIREPFGTAGLVVACIALVAALGGTAFAAAKLSSTQKKEVEKIAKKFAGKPGAPGVNGTNGTAGPQGSAGTNGTNGKDGSSVTTKPIPTSSATCNHLGGTEVTSVSGAEKVCNGQTGFTATLPAGQSERGVWAVSGKGYEEAGTGYLAAGISFNIPLRGALEETAVHVIKPSETTPAGCTGSLAEPGAEEGNLCVFIQFEEHVGSYQDINLEAGELGAGTSGTDLRATGPPSVTGAAAQGVWVVTGN